MLSKRNKKHADWKERKKTVLLVDTMIGHTKNPKTKEKLLELINEFSKITGYNFNIKKKLYFYTTAVNNWKYF